MSSPSSISAEARVVTDVGEWLDLLRGPFRGCADVYHHPDYVLAEARRQGARPGLVVAEAAGHLVGLPLLFRRVPGRADLCDATSVYGYNGLLFSGEPGSEAAPEAIVALERALYLRGCVAVFNRSHPLRPAQLPGRKVVGETLLLPLAGGLADYESGLSEGHAYDLRRMRADGLRAGPDAECRHFADFHRMYLQTMERVGAAAAYSFDAAYLRSQLAMPSLDAQLWLAWAGDRLAAAAVFFRGSLCAHYHLSASDRAVSRHAATKLILDEFIRAEIAAGRRAYLHLGGGVGAAVDSLNRFKRGFGARPAPFALTRWIIRPADYDQLSEGRPEGDYFPAYRNPL